MSSGTDISVLYREFADALTEVLAQKCCWFRAAAADWQELAQRSRDMPTRVSLASASSGRWVEQSACRKTKPVDNAQARVRLLSN
jgi:hypothetical protein